MNSTKKKIPASSRRLKQKAKSPFSKYTNYSISDNRLRRVIARHILNKKLRKTPGAIKKIKEHLESRIIDFFEKLHTFFPDVKTILYKNVELLFSIKADTRRNYVYCPAASDDEGRGRGYEETGNPPLKNSHSPEITDANETIDTDAADLGYGCSTSVSLCDSYSVDTEYTDYSEAV